MCGYDREGLGHREVRRDIPILGPQFQDKPYPIPVSFSDIPIEVTPPQPVSEWEAEAPHHSIPMLMFNFKMLLPVIGDLWERDLHCFLL